MCYYCQRPIFLKSQDFCISLSNKEKLFSLKTNFSSYFFRKLNLIPRGLPRGFSRGVSKGERAFAPLWSPSARVSRAGEIITEKTPRGLPRGVFINCFKKFFGRAATLACSAGMAELL